MMATRVPEAANSPPVVGGEDLGREARITTHRLLAAFDSRKIGIEILHRDLFHSDDAVVHSALEALGSIRDPRSLKLIARLLTQQDEATQCAAVRAVGCIGHTTAVRSLLELFRISKRDPLRAVILEALVRLAPQNGEVGALVREYAGSHLASADLRAGATTLLLKLGGPVDVRLLLDGARDKVIEALYAAAAEDERAAGPVIQHGLSHYHRLTADNRRLLVAAAAAHPSAESARLLVEAMKDVDPVVRRTAYDTLGRCEGSARHLAPIIAQLGEDVDMQPALEEEAIAAIGRLERCLAGREGAGIGEAVRISTKINELFARVSAPERRMGSDSHELGWLIARSKEYLEYYVDEDFRQGILQYLKGSNYYTQDRVLKDLKATAVRVEVRHFEGYQALVDIVKNPKRPGIALISRELAIAKLGKRIPFYQLIRNLHLARFLVGTGREAAAQYARIYTWARDARLYRLAEAALYALARTDAEKARTACRECLSPPVFSKICTIAAIRLLKDMEWEAMEPSVLKLLNVGTDPHILLNLIDALCGMGITAGGEVNRAMLQIVRFGADRGTVQRAADFLGTQSAPGILESAVEGFEGVDDWKQRVVLSLTDRLVREGRVSNREGLVEFLYRCLRAEGAGHQARAAVLLWRLGDDYAARVLKEFVQVQGPEEQVEILRGLAGGLNPEIVAILVPLLRTENTRVQEAVRDTLLSAEDPETRQKVCELALAARGQGGHDEEPAHPGTDLEMQVDVQHEKRNYRFEREYIQDLAILFTDIQGYSKKAQALSTMQLTTLIHEYEGILLPAAASHHGELIKKMGDGHLFVFHAPLNAVLAAIRVQKALKRFNGYREEVQRLVVRIGIHWGKVVRKEGDVLGNHVNIASRLEGSARGGSILISEALHRFLQDHIHSREIGLINVKGITDPIKVFEPHEIALEFPEELDPLKNPRAGAAPAAHRQEPGGVEASRSGAGGDGTGPGSGILLDARALDYLVDTFKSLNALCTRAERGEAGVSDIRAELKTRWTALRAALKRGTGR